MRCARYVDVAMHSECPAETFNDALAPLLAAPALRERFRSSGRSAVNTSKPNQMVLLNVGANKGYVVNSFLQRWHAGWNVSNEQWLRDGLGGLGGCGVCGDCCTKNTEPSGAWANCCCCCWKGIGIAAPDDR